MYPTSPDILQKILSFQELEFLPDAVKIGMIGTLANLNVICDFLHRHPEIPVVLDPVLYSTGGLELLEAAAIPILKEKLWLRATVVTPNLDEVGILLGHRPTTVAEMEAASREMQCGSQVIVVKGGHLDGDPVDMVWDGQELHHLRGKRLEGGHTRGIGCTFAAVIAASMASGKTAPAAIRCAKAYMTQYLERG